MVDISSQNNKINVTVSSSGNTANTNVTPDYAQYYSNKSKEWAISNRIVDNTDYSSKYYANESKKQADISTAKTTEVIESGNTAVTNIESARDNAIIDITNQENLSVDNVNTAGATQVSSVNTAGITQVANVNSAGTTQINLAKEQVTLATNQANIATEQATIATNKASEVVESGNTALSNIDTAKTGALTDITNLKNTSVSNITTAKNSAISTITTQETTSKNNVIATGNAQVERVNLTGVDNRTPIFSKNEIGTNEGVYKNVYDLKHSTFDLSKFTVVGSPTITDDGIASGFSGSDYLQFGTQDFYNKDEWEIIIPYTTSSVADTTQRYLTICDGFSISTKMNSYTGYANIHLSDETNFVLNLGNVTTTSTKYYLKLRYSSINGYSFSYKVATGEWSIPKTNPTTTKVKRGSSQTIGYFTNSTYIFNGSIDLKQFSITVDGKEVFSGNKTGLDVIKPDNYTVVGNPVISDDGVASGFSTSSYLKTLQPYIGSNSKFSIKCDFTTASTIMDSYALFGVDNSSGWYNYIYAQQGFIKFIVQLSDDTFYNDLQINHTFTTKTNYSIEISWDGTAYKLVLYREKEKVSESSYISSLPLKNISTAKLFVGHSQYGNYYFNGSIDLNAFKIYVDGNLVYQPCLKIPYTESKTGSKIVDVAYRDRVIDLYEQEGQAGYYTIDEDNKNFTLPMGEVYGMIEQKADAGRIGEQLAGKVNLDLANLSSEGKEAMTAYWIASGSPTINIPINLTISTTTQYWEAPSNGYVWFYMASASSGAVGFIGVKEEYPDLWSIGNIGRGWLYINKGQHLSVRTDVGTFTLGVLLFTAKQ